jgi:hypothetical protein
MKGSWNSCSLPFSRIIEKSIFSELFTEEIRR